MVFGKLALQIKRRPEVIAPEAARPAMNAYRLTDISRLLIYGRIDDEKVHEKHAQVPVSWSFNPTW